MRLALALLALVIVLILGFVGWGVYRAMGPGTSSAQQAD